MDSDAGGFGHYEGCAIHALGKFVSREEERVGIYQALELVLTIPIFCFPSPL